MNLQQANDWIRAHSHHVMRLAGENDELARSLVRAYWSAYHDKENPEKVDNYLTVLNEYVTRDLTITERKDLENKFAYKMGLPEGGTQIVVPDGLFTKAH